MADPIKLIRIGGTAYSGSTMLGMMLANDPGGFYCGEVNGLFRPYRRHHFQPACGCGDANCTLWKDVYLSDKTAWLRDLHTQVRKTFYVDSSKAYDWLRSEKKGDRLYDTRHVLIWKSPEEYALSRHKRNKLDGWLEDYIAYYQRYFQIVDQCVTVSFSALTADTDAVLTDLCAFLEIPAFAGKGEFWNRQHHSLFGNDCTMLHQSQQEAAQNKKLREKVLSKSLRNTQDMDSQHRQVYTEENVRDRLPLSVLEQINHEPRLERLTEILMGVDACKVVDTSSTSLALMTSAAIWYQRGRKQLNKRIFQMRGCRTWQAPPKYGLGAFVSDPARR